MSFDFGAVFAALLAQPMALVPAIIALVCMIAAVASRGIGSQLLMTGLAIISAATSWIMVTRWRWPES